MKTSIKFALMLQKLNILDNAGYPLAKERQHLREIVNHAHDAYTAGNNANLDSLEEQIVDHENEARNRRIQTKTMGPQKSSFRNHVRRFG